MADDPHNTSDISDTAEIARKTAKEDAETTAARRELKQTSISEKDGQNSTTSSQSDKSGSDDEIVADKPTPQAHTPENGSPKFSPSELKEQVSSPKKKRAHHELDPEEHEDQPDSPKDKEPSEAGSTTGLVKSRTVRSEPEKKRPRDRQADEEARNSADEEVNIDIPLSLENTEPTRLDNRQEPRSDSSARSSLDGKPTALPPTNLAPETKAAEGDKPKTSASTFANSAFGKLASSTTSPFGTLGSSLGSKPSLFGSIGPTSGFGALKAAPSSNAPPRAA